MTDPQELEVPLQQRIAELEAALEFGDSGLDHAELLGELGLAYAERYATDPEPATLARVIDRLSAALAEDPDHAGRLAWCWWLACSYAERADREERLADFDTAIAYASRVRAMLDPDDPDRDLPAVLMVEVFWDRAWQIRYVDDVDDDTAAAEADSLVACIDTISTSGGHPIAQWYVRLLAGLARIERYSLRREESERADLDTGLGLAQPALTSLIAEREERPDAVTDWSIDARLAIAGHIICDAYQDRFALDDNPRDLDLAIAAARAGIAVNDDLPARVRLLYTSLAESLQQRWYMRDSGGDAGAGADLDEAIEAWDTVLQLGWQAWPARNRGELLRERGERTEDPAELREAVALLQSVADAPQLGSWYERNELALAEKALWRLTADRVHLLAAAEHLDIAFTLPIEPDDRLVLMHLDRVNIEQQLVDDGLARKLDKPGNPSMLRELVEAGERVLDRAVRADPQLRAGFAALLGFGHFSAVSIDEGPINAKRVRALLSLGATARDVDPGFGPLIDYAFGILENYEDTINPRRSSEFGIGRLSRAFASGQIDGSAGQGLRDVLGIAVRLRAGLTGDLRMARAMRPRKDGRSAIASTGMTRLIRPAEDDHTNSMLDAFGALLEHVQSGNYAEAKALLSRLKPVLDQVDPASDEGWLAYALRMVANLLNPQSDTAITVPPLDGSSTLRGLMQRGAAFIAMSALLGQSAMRGDTAGLRTVLEHAEAAVDVVPAGETRTVAGAHHVAGYAALLLAQHSPAEQQEYARRAIGHFEIVAKHIGGHDHPIWVWLAMQFAESFRLSGEAGRARSREFGMSALRAHAWRVFVQSGTDHAVTSAREAAAHARTVIDWCLTDRELEPGIDDELIAALDAGRGLVLRATTGSRLVVDRLVARGHAQLAEEWRATSGQGRNQLTGLPLAMPLDQPTDTPDIPDQLRLKVLHALADEELIGFEPVTSADIRTGLAAVCADALIYLVPGVGPTAGRAVVVPATGDPTVLWLPALDSSPGSLVQQYAEAKSRSRESKRDLDLATVPAKGLEALCAWAWSAAIGPLLGLATRWELRRPVRLVLVPLGPLSLVPWHAAFTIQHEQRRYAIDDAVISYTPSAQMLCAAARMPATPIRSSLVVGNPGGDLWFAGIEAQAVHRQFYRGIGTYFGLPAHAAHRPGSPEDVLAWIDASPAGPSSLHFACHGAVDPDRPAEAHLVLAGGAQLSARTLLDRARSTAVDIAEVFLAACTTHVTGTDHDEVLSLATSFLAAGVRTVFGSLYRVPDGDTSLLMFMVHYFLREHACRPADALHRAQLWMLDPMREIPSTMPADLRRHVDRGHVFELRSWAGFIHLGR